MLVGCNRQTKPTAPIERYKLEGVVVSINPQEHTAKIDGQKIEGWMDAMTMDYPVKDPAELTKLHPGDHVAATVFVQGLDYWIGEIQVR